jgi:hypothetical protein
MVVSRPKLRNEVWIYRKRLPIFAISYVIHMWVGYLVKSWHYNIYVHINYQIQCLPKIRPIENDRKNQNVLSILFRPPLHHPLPLHHH